MKGVEAKIAAAEEEEEVPNSEAISVKKKKKFWHQCIGHCLLLLTNGLCLCLWIRR